MCLDFFIHCSTLLVSDPPRFDPVGPETSERGLATPFLGSSRGGSSSRGSSRVIQLQLLESAKRSGHGHLLELPQVDARLVPRRNRPCREHDREADAAASKPPRRQEQSGSTSSLSRRRCRASKRECRSLYVLHRCEDHTWQLSRFSSAVPDGLGSIACRGDARDSELPEAQSCVSCVDGLYHGARTHLALGKDTPEPRSVQPPDMGKVIEIPEVGGLHHRYERRAA
jgi:hypothetical protein